MVFLAVRNKGCFPPTAESFGVSAQIGSGVVRGGPEVRFHEDSTRVPRGFHQGSRRVSRGFHEGFTRVPGGFHEGSRRVSRGFPTVDPVLGGVQPENEPPTSGWGHCRSDYPVLKAHLLSRLKPRRVGGAPNWEGPFSDPLSFGIQTIKTMGAHITTIVYHHPEPWGALPFQALDSSLAENELPGGFQMPSVSGTKGKLLTFGLNSETQPRN